MLPGCCPEKSESGDYHGPYAPCVVYLPTKLGDFVRANVGIHIPAPWFAIWVEYLAVWLCPTNPWEKPGATCDPW